MGEFANVEWDLPVDVTGEVFACLSCKMLAICSCVSKNWRDLAREDRFRRKKILDRNWRFGIVHPQRRVFGGPGEFDMLSSAKSGSTIALGAYDGIVLLDASNNSVLAKDFSGYGNCLCIIDGMLLSTDGERSVRSWRIAGLDEIITFEVGFVVNAIVGVGDSIAIAGANGSLGLWGKGASMCARVLHEGGIGLDDQASSEDIFCLAFCKESCTLVCGSRGGSLELWCLVSFACVQAIEDHTEAVRYVEINANVIFSVSDGRAIHLWDRKSKERIWALNIGGVFYTSCVAFFGDRFACDTREGDVKVWDVQEGGCLRTLQVGDDIVGVFLTDESLTVVLFDGVVLEWDFTAATGN